MKQDLLGSRRWASTRLWHSMDGWMWLFYGNLSTRDHSKKAAEQWCRPLRRLILVFFTVNPQWSHQHWYERVDVRFPASVVLFPYRCLQCKRLLFQIYIFFTVLCVIFLANVSSGAHLRQISHTAIQFISTHNPVFLDLFFFFKYII